VLITTEFQAKASSGFNAVGSNHQHDRNVSDSPDIFISDTLTAGHGLSDRELVEILAQEAAPALAWLESKSALALEVVSRCGGHSVPRTHRLKEAGKPRAVGWELLSGLGKAAKAIEAAGVDQADAKVKIKILTGVRVVALHSTAADADGKPATTSLDYIKAGETPEPVYNAPDLLANLPLPADLTIHNLPLDALILTTGGYSRSPALLAAVPPTTEHPPLDKLPTTNSPFTTGDGIHLARALNPAFEPIHMDHLQIHPTGFVDPKDPEAVTKMLGPEALRAHGGILVTKSGLRFVNELGRRDEVAGAIFAQLDTTKPTNGQHVFLILDKPGYEEVGPATMDFYTAKGNFRVFETIEELAAGLGVPEDALKSTLKAYSGHEHAHGQPDEFNKSVFPTPMVEGPFRAAMITPVLHYSPGGIPFLPTGELVSQKKEIVVRNLFGAGEVTGGVHGGGRLAGNSLAECGVWGRRSGRNAAAGLV
jgi:flavocytochrome c